MDVARQNETKQKETLPILIPSTVTRPATVALDLHLTYLTAHHHRVPK
jgi:hypothetical protein